MHIEKVKNIEEELARRDREIVTLYKLSDIFQSHRSLHDLYQDIVEEIRNATGFPIAFIAIYDKTREKIIFQGATKGLPSLANKSILEVPTEETYAGVVVRTGKPLIITHMREQKELGNEALKQIGAQTFIGYPMIVNQKIIGSLGLAHLENIELDAHAAQWIESLANYVAALTERKRTEEELRSSREQLRELSIHRQYTIEEERKNIAREIHDELGQQLSLLQLEIGYIERKLSVKQKELRKKTRAVSKLINSSILTIQRITSDLRPTLLDNIGLSAAVEWHTKEFQKRTKIKCKAIIEPPEIKLDQDRSTALYRILQEALTNVVRHARATKIKVHLKLSDQSIELSILDNGIGISTKHLTDPKSFGLITMKERVFPFGGTVNIIRTPRKGTQITAFIPGKS
jgi:signal transduction histidine kinase